MKLTTLAMMVMMICSTIISKTSNSSMMMKMTMTLPGGGCGEAEDMRDAFEVSSISSNSDQNTALNSETIHC